MSDLLKIVVGQSVAPNAPDHDETPVPYRRTLPSHATPVVEGSLPGEPAKAETPIAEQPGN